MHEYIAQYLQALAKVRGPHGYGYEQFVLDYGIALTGNPLPRGIRGGLPKHCFHNALHLMDRAHCVYMEGFAVSTFAPLVAHHGWVWDLNQGLILDNTWSLIKGLDLSTTTYFGIPFRSAIVNRGAVINEAAGLFYDWRSPKPGWLLGLPPDEFFHPLTSPYPRGGPHGSAKDPRQLPCRRSRHHPLPR